MGWHMDLILKILRRNDLHSLKTAVQGNTEFALDLYQKLRGVNGNLFFSPYSISMALAMTYAGARGDTQTQMAHTLHFGTDGKRLHSALSLLRKKLLEAENQGKVQLKVANSLWPRMGYVFQKSFLSLMIKYYGVSIAPVDFGDGEAARTLINNWVAENTENKIKDLIASGFLDSATRLILVNAVYFKGEWSNLFDPNLTDLAPFQTALDGEVQVQMMALKHAFRYVEMDGFQILELPYTGDALSMIALLPREVDGLVKLEDSLLVENLNQWVKNLVETEVEVSLPRFELAFPFRLDDTLKSMGMEYAFSENADFSEMDESRELYLGAVLHKAFVSVNEHGTEAAAATAVVMQLKSISFPSVVFCADHPFVFLIRENTTGSILFMGRVSNPA